MDEVKYLDSLDSYLLHRIREWEEANPRPNPPEHLQKSVAAPQKFLVPAHNAEGYVSGHTTGSLILQIKSHVQKNNKTASLAFTYEDLCNLIEALLTLQCDMQAYHEWVTNNEAQALHHWKTQRGQMISEWKHEYQELAEEGGA